jgi:hypothetical protein
MPVKIDKSQVVASQTILISPASKISACKTIDDFIRLTATTIMSDEEAIEKAMPTKETPALTTASSTGTETPANATATNPQGRTTRQSTGAAREAAGSRSNDPTNPIEADGMAPRATTRQGGRQGASRANATQTGGRGQGTQGQQ